MNKILSLSDAEFEKRLKSWPKDEKESIWKLIGREVDLQMKELERSEELLKNAQVRKNNLEVSRYEQSIRDGELQLELLQRRMYLCQPNLENKSIPRQTKPVSSNSNRNASSSSLVFNSTKQSDNHQPHYNNISNKSPNETSEVSINTKSLISDFEKLNSKTVKPSGIKSPQSTTPANQKKELNINKSPEKLPSSELNNDEDCNSNYYSHVKLKKVGLPPDAEKTDQDLYNFSKPNKVSTAPTTTQNETYTKNIPQRKSSQDVNGSNKFNGDISIPNQFPSSKDKFHNPNLEIRAAIESELKQISLKPVVNKESSQNTKTTVNSAMADSLTLGKFDFSCERNLCSTNPSSNTNGSSMSASKSMPFLSQLSSNQSLSTPPASGRDTPSGEGLTTNHTHETLQPISQQEINNEQLVNCSTNQCDITTWDPRPILQDLYKIVKQSSSKKVSSKNGLMKFAEYIDVFFNVNRGTKFSKGFQRLYAIISNNELQIFENQASRIPIDHYSINEITVESKDITHQVIDISDSKGLVVKLKIVKTASFNECLKLLNSGSNSDKTGVRCDEYDCQIIPNLYSSVLNEHEIKLIIVDLGSCSIRAGILKTEVTLPAVYMPHIVAIDKSTQEAVAVGLDACDPQLKSQCHIIRLIKPDSTLEHIAFTSGAVEMVFKSICRQLKVDPKDYKIMLSVPHYISDATRTKLADVLLFRLNCRGVSMCGQSLLALHAYGQPTGVLIDIGYRTEILPVTEGVVQSAGVFRSILGGHLLQIAVSHMLPFPVHSVTDFIIPRYIMEKHCTVAKNHDEAYKDSNDVKINLKSLNLPKELQNELTLCNKDLCLPLEGLFNPDIYSLDMDSLIKLLRKSIMACPVDCRKDLLQSICLSGAATQFSGLCERIQAEMQKQFPTKCQVISAEDRQHYSYVGACFVAMSDQFLSTIVQREEWEDSRNIALKKWHF